MFDHEMVPESNNTNNHYSVVSDDFDSNEEDNIFDQEINNGLERNLQKRFKPKSTDSHENL